MRNSIVALAALGAAVTVSAPASAATTFKIDTAKTSVGVSNNNVLCLLGNCSLSASLASPLPTSFNLNPGQSYTFDFARFVVGNGLGIGSAAVNATLSFLTPGGSASTGGTDSYLRLAGVFNAGLTANSFNWTNPVQTITANGANYTVSFADVAGIDCGNSFTAQATVRLNSVAAVPEIGTWAMMILGVGVLGAAMRRERRPVATTVRFA